MHPIVIVSRVGTCHIDRSWLINNRTSEFWRLYFNFSPGAIIESGGSRLDPGDGRIVLIPAGCTFSTVPPSEKTLHLFIHFSISEAAGTPSGKPLSIPVDESINTMIGKPEDWNGNLLLGCALVYKAISSMMSHFKSASGADGDYSLKYIQENLHSRISVKMLARRSGLSIDHFIRIFSARYGTTPARYITQLRVETAKRLMSTTRLPLDEIASLCGYNSRTHFSSSFRRETGASPTGFRMRVVTLPSD